MKRAIIIGTCLICASAIISADKIYDLSQNSNAISLTSGKVRLGEVYNETLTTVFKVSFDESGLSAMNINSNTVDIYQVAIDEMNEIIESINKDRKKSKEEELSLDTVSWTKNATITITTTVSYQSQHQSNFNLAIDETIIKHTYIDGADNKTINSYLSTLKDYASKMNVEYKKDNSFI